MILPYIGVGFPWFQSSGALVSILRWRKRVERATGMWLISHVVQGTPLALFNIGGKASVNFFQLHHLRLKWVLFMSKSAGVTLLEVSDRLSSEVIMKM